MTAMTFEERFYRDRLKVEGLTRFHVRVQQTDLMVRAGKDLSSEAYDLAGEVRRVIEDWAGKHPEFLTGLKPLPADPSAPDLIRRMLKAGQAAGVGPMASVAGCVAEYVGRGLEENSPEGVIVENGGDLYISADRPIVVGLYAGQSPLSMKIGWVVDPDRTPMGLCTSSGSLGHSLSLGKADAAVVSADNSELADATATALGNRIQGRRDIEPALKWATSINGVRGVAAIIGDHLGLMGEVEVKPL